MLFFTHLYLHLLLWLLWVSENLSFNLLIGNRAFESFIKNQLLVQACVENLFIDLILDRACHALR